MRMSRNVRTPSLHADQPCSFSPPNGEPLRGRPDPAWRVARLRHVGLLVLREAPLARRFPQRLDAAGWRGTHLGAKDDGRETVRRRLRVVFGDDRARGREHHTGSVDAPLPPPVPLRGRSASPAVSCYCVPANTCPNAFASITAVRMPPTANTTTPARRLESKRPTRQSSRPTIRLKLPHHTFTTGDDSPCPGGEANGLGNGRPETPLVKCGTELTRKAPAKNSAT